MTAIMDPSGAGKSTMADLILGLLSPDQGTVKIDGKALSGDFLHRWRRSVGYVPQDTFLFHDTIRANLLWARPDAEDKDLWRVAFRRRTPTDCPCSGSCCVSHHYCCSMRLPAHWTQKVKNI